MVAIDLDKMVGIDLSKQTTSTSEHLERTGNTKIFFITGEAKEINLDFSQESEEAL